MEINQIQKDLQQPLITERDKNLQKKHQNKKNLYEQSCCLIKPTFFWMNSFIKQYKSKTFKQEDHFDLQKNYCVQYQQQEFEDQANKAKSYWFLLLKQFKNKFLYSLVLIFICLSKLFHVFVVYKLTMYLQFNEKEDKSVLVVGLVLASILAVQFLSTMCQNYITYMMKNDMAVFKNKMQIYILKKVLRMQQMGSQNSFAGNIINLVQIDCQKIEQQGHYALHLIYTLTNSILVFVASFYIVGYCFGFYLLVQLIFQVFSALLYIFISKVEYKLLLVRDDRISLQNNVFKNIRYIKLNVLENFYVKYIYNLKIKELKFLRRSFILDSFVVQINWASPTVAMSVLYFTYFYFNKTMNLGQFMAVSEVLIVADFVFKEVPFVLSVLQNFSVTFTRFDTFLKLDENQLQYYKENQNSEYSLKIKNGKFDFGNKQIKKFKETMADDKKKDDNDQSKKQNEPKKGFELKNINLQINKGELVFVIGQIGSGKSALIHSILGYLRKEQNSEIEITQDYVYCPQVPLILQKSIENNILFYRQYDSEKLNKAIEMAQLSSDIKIFENGTEKICTEDGLNLSGGQRQRVGLARTFYEEKDLYVFDDCFSALDVQVANKIIKNSIVKQLNGKTRIVCTHSVQYLKYSDKVLFLENGEIVFQGTFQQFKDTEYYSDLQKQVQKEQKEDKKKQKTEERIKKVSVEDSLNIDNITKNKYFIEEEQLQGRQTQVILQMIQKYYGGFTLLLVIFCLTLIPSISYYKGYIILYDFILDFSKQKDQKWTILKYYALINIIPSFVTIIRLFVQTFLSIRMVRKVHHNMMIVLMHGSIVEFYDRIPLARVINLFSNDIINVGASFFYSFDLVVQMSTFFIFSAVVSFMQVSFYIIITFVIYIVICFYFQNIYIKLKKIVYRLQNITKTPIVNQTREIVEGRHQFQLYKKEHKAIECMQYNLNENTKNLIVGNALDGWFNSILCVFTIFIFQLSVFGFSLFLLKNGTISTQGFMISLVYLLQMIGEFGGFLNSISDFETNVVSLERCDAIQNIPIDQQYTNFKQDKRVLLKNINKPLRFFIQNFKQSSAIQKYFYDEINQYGFQQEIFQKGEIFFDNISVIYPNTYKYALKNVTMRISSGQIVGICGQTGSGKSTLIKCLVKFANYQSGQIIIDDYDTQLIDLKVLRQQMLVISQEISLFKGTLLENLFLKKRQDLNQQIIIKQNSNEQQIVSQESTEKGLEQEILQKLIEFGFSQDKLQDVGLQLEIQQGGKNLSIGERQLISIFRALFSQKQIVILDEATSAMDYNTEQKVMDYIFQQMKGKTIIMIAHRLKTILNSDKIAVLSKGRLIEFDNTQSLLQNQDSAFYKMLDSFETI